VLPDPDNFQGIGAPGGADGFSHGEDHQIPLGYGAPGDEQLLRLVEQHVPIRVQLAHEHRAYFPKQGHLGDGALARGEGVDGHTAVEPAHPQGGGAGLGKGGDGLDLEVVGGPDGGHGNGLVDAGEDPVQEFPVQGHFGGALRFQTDPGHGFHRFHRVFAAGGFGG